jgi:fluoride exporter
VARFLWICLGGAVGSGARYLVALAVLGRLGPAFPWGTLAVNAVGSFLLGALMHVGLTTEWFSPTLRLALTTGVLGGFTTYSTFNYETLEYLREGAAGLALLNVAATLVLCLVAGWLGFALGRALVGG